MTGVEILSEHAVYITQTWVYVVGILAAIGAMIFGIMCANSKGSILPWISCVGFILCTAIVFTLGFVDNNSNYLKEYRHTELQVTIDDSVSMNEFLDKYEITDQEGKIYTVKERE